MIEAFLLCALLVGCLSVILIEQRKAIKDLRERVARANAVAVDGGFSSGALDGWSVDGRASYGSATVVAMRPAPSTQLHVTDGVTIGGGHIKVQITANEIPGLHPHLPYGNPNPVKAIEELERRVRTFMDANPDVEWGK